MRIECEFWEVPEGRFIVRKAEPETIYLKDGYSSAVEVGSGRNDNSFEPTDKVIHLVNAVIMEALWK